MESTVKEEEEKNRKQKKKNYDLPCCPKKPNLQSTIFDEIDGKNFQEINGVTSADEKMFFFHPSVFFWKPRPHSNTSAAIETWMNWSSDREINMSPHTLRSHHPLATIGTLKLMSAAGEAIVSLGRPGCETRRAGFILNLQGLQSHLFPSNDKIK